LSVEPLTSRDAVMNRHFTSPEVQYVGFTSNWGCDFPHATFQNGGWPEIDYQEAPQTNSMLLEVFPSEGTVRPSPLF
jgi:hypothetical protein